MQISLGPVLRGSDSSIFWFQCRGHVIKGQAWAYNLEFGTSSISGNSTEIDLFQKSTHACKKARIGKKPIQSRLRKGQKLYLWTLAMDMRLVRSLPNLALW